SKSPRRLPAYKSTMSAARRAATVRRIPALPKVASVRPNPHPDRPAPRLRLLATAAALALAGLAGCASTTSAPDQGMQTEAVMFEHMRSSQHRDGDDLLTAGLGLDGLRQMVPPA